MCLETKITKLVYLVKRFTMHKQVTSDVSQDPDGRDRDQDRDLEKIRVQDPRPSLEKIFDTEIETR